MRKNFGGQPGQAKKDKNRDAGPNNKAIIAARFLLPCEDNAGGNQQTENQGRPGGELPSDGGNKITQAQAVTGALA